LQADDAGVLRLDRDHAGESRTRGERCQEACAPERRQASPAAKRKDYAEFPALFWSPSIDFADPQDKLRSAVVFSPAMDAG
jgi:hypothetical protein